MRNFALGRSRLNALIAVALISGCAGSEPPAGVPGTAFGALSTANCPANPYGNGILTDGDFSQAADPGSYQGIEVGTQFAPDWIVSERTIDFYGSGVSWQEPHGLCSIDLDGSGHEGVGAITHARVPTNTGTTYTIRFILSGNVNCARGQGNPPIKRLLVEAVSKSGTLGQVFHWNTADNRDAQHGDFKSRHWQFTALNAQTSFVFQSVDRPDKSNCGPVVAGISVSQS